MSTDLPLCWQKMAWNAHPTLLLKLIQAKGASNFQAPDVATRNTESKEFQPNLTPWSGRWATFYHYLANQGWPLWKFNVLHSSIQIISFSPCQHFYIRLHWTMHFGTEALIPLSLTHLCATSQSKGFPRPPTFGEHSRLLFFSNIPITWRVSSLEHISEYVMTFSSSQ